MDVNKFGPIMNNSVNQSFSSIKKAFKNDTKSFKESVSQLSLKKSSSVGASRVDKIEISSAAQPQNVSSSFDINRLKEKILADINNEASPAKINEISNKIESGSYSVSSDEIAKLILKI